MTASIPARDPLERAALQRERILRAARQGFVRRGFQGASMADIAHSAEMSPGLIYRYFPSKTAIVHAIIDREMEEARRILDRLGSADDLVAAVLEVFERWTRGGDEEMNAALFLEMVAASARDEELAEVMRRADTVIRERLEEVLQRGGGARADAAAAPSAGCRAAMLQCLIEGLLVRAVRQPDLDRRTLREFLGHALAALTAGPAPHSNEAAG